MLKIEEYLNNFLESKEISEFVVHYVFEIAMFELLYIRYGKEEFEEKIQEFFDVEILQKSEQTDETREMLESLVEGLKTERNSYKNNMCIVQLNTTFENYLYKFAQYWLEKRIGILDECTVSLKEVRQMEQDDLIFQKIDDFIHDKLLRKDYENTFSMINKRFNVNLSFDKNDIESLNEFYAMRNVIVHSSGKIDRRYKSKCPDSEYNINDKIYVSDDYLKRIERLLLKIITVIDRLLISNFPELVFNLKNLAQPKFKPLKLE